MKIDDDLLIKEATVTHDGIPHTLSKEKWGWAKQPEMSDWKCELFGMGPRGIVFMPLKGKEPNWFWRWMQYIILGNKWIYEKDQNTKT